MTTRTIPAFPKLGTFIWECPNCNRGTPVNMNHPRGWVEGNQEKMFCWTCRKTLKHTVRRVNA